MSFIANLLAMIGLGTANAGTQACNMFLMDEPKAPKALIEK